MCGRFSLFAPNSRLEERFHVINWDEFGWSERYNIAPSQAVLAIVKGKRGNRAGLLRWGLVPFWAKDAKIGYKMINARAETVNEKPSFRRLLRRRRCLIPADGFYEWKREETVKQPYRFQLKTKEPFAFAGLWDRWENNGETIQTCTIITTEANSLVGEVHPRMPVILTKESEQIWLDRTIQYADQLTSLLVPYDERLMEMYPVSTLVNSPYIDTKEVITAIPS